MTIRLFLGQAIVSTSSWQCAELGAGDPGITGAFTH